MDASFDFVRRIVPETSTSFLVPSGFAGPADFGVNLRAWYDATTGVFSDAGVTPATDGGTVQQWNDQSGNNYHLLQGTAGQRPFYRTTALNSLPAVETTTDPRGMLTTVDSANFNSASYGAFIVLTLVGAAGFGRVASFVAAGDAFDFTTTTSTLFCLLDGGGTGINGAGSGVHNIVTATPYRYAYANVAGTATAYLDNVASGAGAGYSGTLSSTGTITLASARSDSINTPNNSYVSEIVLINRAPTSDEITGMYNYFTAKWGF